MKQVSKEYFYNVVVGDKDVVTCIVDQYHYPYTTNFKTRYGKLVGVCKDRYGNAGENYTVSEYFIPEV